MHTRRIHPIAGRLPHEIVAARAYALWDWAGRPEGRDREFWFLAEQGLTAALLGWIEARSVHYHHETR